MKFTAPLVLALLCALPVRAAEVIEADLCIYGGTSAGIAAAVQAARLGRSAVIVNPTRYLGGLTTGGLGATDIGNKAAIGGVSREFYHRIARHYARPEAWTRETAQEYFTRRRGGQSAVSSLEGPDATMWTFEPHVADAVFKEMLREAKTPVHLEKRLQSVKKDGARLTELHTHDGTVFRAKMFLDTTYEGDLLAAAGCSFHIGREANATYGETLNGIRAETPKHQFLAPVDPYVRRGDPASGLLPFVQPGDGGRPGDGDRSVQAYNFRLCFTTDDALRLPATRPVGMSEARFAELKGAANNRLPVAPPANYDPAQFELLGRYMEALAAANKRPGLGQFWNPIWMPNHKTDINNNGGFSTDFIGLNYDFPAASFEARARSAREHEDYIRGFLTFLATDARVPESLRREMQSWGPCRDEFADTAGWPRELYVREARRLIGAYVMTEKNCRYQEAITDSVGLAAYNMDSHNCQRLVKNGRAENEGDVQVAPMKPYPISYRSLIPKPAECANLLVPVCLSSTHIAYGSIRMEPVFMLLAQSAVTAASLAIEKNTSVQQVDYAALRTRLLADKQVLDWTGGGGGGTGKFVDPKSLPGIVLDEADAKMTGEWQESHSIAWRVGRGYHHDGNANKGGCAATFAPEIPQAGEYEIILFHSPNANRASNVPVTVTVQGGETRSVKISQKEGGEKSLGRFKLPAGKSVTVSVSNAGTDGHVILDGVQFKLVR